MDRTNLTNIPDQPGIYIFKDKSGGILYIGKARSLKKRVKYYFTQPLPSKIQAMVSKINDMDYIVAGSETEARLREAVLIKENSPFYNTVFRDDKTFPLICISDEDFPMVWVARRTSKRLRRALRCFGPYPNAGLLRQALKTLRHIFGFRSCFKMPKKACLYYRLNLCPAPCIGRISKGKYQEIIKNIIMFLEERAQDLIERLSFKMEKLASQKRFEEAAIVRNQIQALSSISIKTQPSLSKPYQESEELKKLLGLKIPPRRIEAFDVSNIAGCQATASMVSFYKGKPDKKNYRRFRIKSISGVIDDYQMLKETIQRRYQRVIKENLAHPDLILIDGGKGQLNIAKKQLQDLGLKISIISIAKPRKTSGLLRGRQNEEIFIPDKDLPLELKADSAALNLIKRIRDEAHRFALAYHRILRRKKTLGK